MELSRSDQGSSAGDVSSFYSILVSISFLLVSLLAPRHDGRKGEYISRGKMGRRSFVFSLSSSFSDVRSQTFVLLVRLSSVPSHLVHWPIRRQSSISTRSSYRGFFLRQSSLFLHGVNPTTSESNVGPRSNDIDIRNTNDNNRTEAHGSTI